MSLRPTIRSGGTRVTFLGAAQTVTGSMHLVEVGNQRILMECGLAREEGDQGKSAQTPFPFDPKTIDALIVTHAHMDHCGNIPNLVRQGFQGPIYCTSPTKDLMAYMLADSARINEDDTGPQGNAVGQNTPSTSVTADIRYAMAQCETVSLEKNVEIGEGIRLKFFDAGHILGSAMVNLAIENQGKKHSITFTGDLGRLGLPFISEPAEVPACDLLICESTYGGRLHDPVEAMAQKMAAVFKRTVERGGKLFIPAFTLGRTQIVVHYLQQWMEEKIIPTLPIFVDSPLACNISNVYQEYAPGDFRIGGRPGQQKVTYIRSADDSREISLKPGPMVIVASGGMCDGGRILGHLRNHVDDPRSSVVLVSYQSPYSLGNKLLEKNPTVRFQGKIWNKWIEIAQITGFSGHADHQDFQTLLKPLAGHTRQVRLVHGELQQAETLAQTLRGLGFPDVGVPHKGEVVSLD